MAEGSTDPAYQYGHEGLARFQEGQGGDAWSAEGYEERGQQGQVCQPGAILPPRGKSVMAQPKPQPPASPPGNGGNQTTGK